MASENRWETVQCDQPGTYTLRENESGRLMHSRVGPWHEANEIYVAQSDFNRRREVVIYDVGLGIAANALAAIEASSESSIPGGRLLQIYSFECYPEALRQALITPERFSFLAPHLDAIRSLLDRGEWQSPDGQVKWNLIAGDFREINLAPLPTADLVYFDFYAPATCPELWALGIFSKLYAKMRTAVDAHSTGSLLITYASTKAVRSAMLLAGFFVGEGVSTPMKRESTVASPQRETLSRPIDAAWLARLERSDKPLPIDWPKTRQEEALEKIRAHPQFANIRERRSPAAPRLC